MKLSNKFSLLFSLLVAFIAKAKTTIKHGERAVAKSSTNELMPFRHNHNNQGMQYLMIASDLILGQTSETIQTATFKISSTNINALGSQYSSNLLTTSETSKFFIARDNISREFLNNILKPMML